MKKTNHLFLLFFAIFLLLISSTSYSADDFETALKNGNIHSVKSFLAQWPDSVNGNDKYSMTPLDIAAANGHFELASFLLSKGADPNLKLSCDRSIEFTGFTALHFAGIARENKIYDLFISKGAKPDIFSECAMGRKNEVIKILKNHLELLDSGICGDGTPTPIHFAAMGGQVDIIKYLMVKGAKTYPHFHEAKTPIQLAAKYKHPETVKYLLALGADANAMEGNNDLVPLYYAVENHDLATARILLSKGANPNWSHWGNGLLKMAANQGNVDTCALLIEYGAEVNKGDQYNITPMHEAANPQVADLLLRKGAKLNAIDHFHEGCNPFMSALGHGREQTAKFLLLKGADITNHCEEGYTALPLAAEQGYTEICRILIAKGAPINLVNNDVGWPGYTPLDFAIIGGHWDTVKLLLDHGAKVNLKDNDGNTPLKLAETKGQKTIATLIKKYGGVE